MVNISADGLHASGGAAGEDSQECLSDHNFSRNLVVAELQEIQIDLQKSLRDSLSQSMLEEEKLREQLRSLRGSLGRKKSSHQPLRLHLRTYETGSNIDFKVRVLQCSAIMIISTSLTIISAST